MKYQADDGSEVEWIWNSRDGVTPFCVTSRSGKMMTHVEWRLDKYLPDYKPKAGERIFVDMTVAKATEYARERIDREWDHPQWPARKHWLDKETAVRELAEDMMKPAGQPDIEIVT